jgi:NTP pyrophosphatase (non-canonical NTP hydrolase)
MTKREHPLHDSADPATSWALNPWVPMTRPIDLKHLGKFGEELNECGAAVNRCIIQGIDEAEPVTGKVNRAWLEDEIADVLANVELVIGHFGLDMQRIYLRSEKKKKHLGGWHSMLDGGSLK